MATGSMSLLSGFVAFLVTTTTVLVFATDRDFVDAMTVGGLTGGAVALGVWCIERGGRLAARDR